MSAPARLGPIKITLDEDAEPGLYQALAGVPVKSRSRRMVALANLGAIVERQGLAFAGQASGGISVAPGAASTQQPAALVEDTPAEPVGATARRPDAVEALGEGLDDFLTNLSGPLAS